MPVENLADVVRFVERVRAKVIRRVEALPPEAQDRQPEPGRWSALEHLEHLALAERWLLETLARLLAEAERDGRRAPEGAPRQVDATPVLFASGAVGTRKVAPANLLPSGKELAELKAMLAASRADLLAAVARMEAIDTDQITVQVPVAQVTLNAAQLVHFVGVHEWLHLQHIEGVATALGATGETAG